ncbi:rhomboid family intramembrane serine protease [Actinomycetospora callitridis]|uniref:rhomboid family intramembrane serine protease n=1 Tax=Actinomycetospora callitridis TaxID=913944 RepID=UPI002366CF89|nr:rhomboid family intramembrane serine protease [Actinomycetospora callitridis]MDD7917289.1 rhomboid family intramembrane serine protease [Actinomycetospora callitridis]
MTSPSGVPARPAPRIWPAQPLRAAVTITAFVALLWVLEILDRTVFVAIDPPQGLDDDGIIPRSVEGLGGILWAPFLHGGFEHLASNTVPLLVFGFLVLAGGLGQFLAVTAVIWVVSGVGTWLIGSPGSTIGASGIIFGWFAFLLVRGFFARSVGQIVLAVVLFLIYGSLLLGVLPSNPGISWQAHLCGAIGGIIAARFTVAADRRRPGPTGTPAVS